MGSQIKPKAREDNIVVQKLGDETLIYDLAENKAFCLNDTSVTVWEMCNGKRSIEEIETEMSIRMKILVGEDLVYLALDQLGKDGLLENHSESHFAGLSRREVIRKVGFASMVALPVVSSIIAPTALMAQSACVPGTGAGNPNAACTTDAECANCNCTGAGGAEICCAPGVNHADPLPTGQAFCASAPDCASSFTASIRCCSTGTASPTVGMCPSPGQIACVCD